MAKLHMKRCWTLLISREMQIKTTLKYHLTQVRKAIIKKSTNNKPWRGCGEKWILPHCWWKCKLLQSLWRTVWRFLKKLKRAFWERLLACMLVTSIFFGIPHTTWFGERRGASLNFVVSNALGSFFVREITKVKILGSPWTVACQAPLSMEFPGKNTGVEAIPFSMGIFLTQGLNLETPALQVNSLSSETPGKMSSTLLER